MTPEAVKNDLSEREIDSIDLDTPLEFSGVVFIEGRAGAGPRHLLGHVTTQTEAGTVKESLEAFLASRPSGRAQLVDVTAEFRTLRAALSSFQGGEDLSGS